MFHSSQLMYNRGCGNLYTHPIEQSLRFNDDDSAYLSWTPASAGNRRTWTWSGWVKLCNLSNPHILFSGGDGSTSDRVMLQRTTAGALVTDLGGTGVYDQSEAIFRDPSAWYHIVWRFDTTDATGSNRSRIWVNGEEITLTKTRTWTLNSEWGINRDQIHTHGVYSNLTSADFIDAYMAEVNFIDGTALTADSFGELKNDVWIPKDPTGLTYGTNGFYLDFADSADIGNDVSGQNNDWTPNNLTTDDVVLDSPTDNFATLNPLDKLNSPTFSQGNLRYYPNASGVARSTLGFNSGKFYFEICQESSVTTGTPFIYGLCELEGAVTHTTFQQGVVVYNDNGTGHSVWTFVNGSQVQDDTGYFTTTSAGDVWQFAYDADTGKVWVGRNGTWFNSGNPAAGTGFIYQFSGDYTMAPVMDHAAANYTAVLNTGQDSSFAGNKTAQGNTDSSGRGDFFYTPPEDFKALCTANLPCPPINNAKGSSASDYFGTLLYTGDSTTDRLIATGESGVTGDINFTPDFVWIKNRNAANSHTVDDVVRGAGTSLFTNATAAEVVYGTDGVDSFNTDGFTVSHNASNNQFNFSGRTYVAWNWKANGAGVSNSGGSIPSAVSANTESGFSIVTYGGNSTAGATVGHGLSSVPDLIIVKNRTGTEGFQNWGVYSSELANTQALFLNTTGAATTNIEYWNNTSPTSDVFSLGYNTNSGWNITGQNFVAYCFHGVEGFSKFGSYEGNGNADGPFVYTGFRPAFLVVKRTNGIGNWHMLDSKRDIDNVVGQNLYPNLSDAELTDNTCDFLSNGFKMRVTSSSRNGSGDSYIYMAFAEVPFKYSLAR